MAADQFGQTHRVCKLDVEVARVAQDHDEGIDGAPPTRLIHRMPATRPISLRLFAGRRLKAHGHLGAGAGLWVERADEAADNIDATRVAHPANLRQQAHGVASVASKFDDSSDRGTLAV